MPKQSKQLKLIKRSRAAALLDSCPRTLRRWENLGLLHPIKLNSRNTSYYEDEVLRLAQGRGAMNVNAAELA